MEGVWVIILVVGENVNLKVIVKFSGMINFCLSCIGIRKEKKDVGEKFIGEVSLVEGGMGYGIKLFLVFKDEDGWLK